MTLERIQRFIQQLSNYQIVETIQIKDWRAQPGFYREPGKYEFDSEETFLINEGDWLIDLGTTMFLEKDVSIPLQWRNRPFGLTFLPGLKGGRTLHEALVSINGMPYHGIDRNRSYVPFPEYVRGKETINIKIELFNYAGQSLDELNYQNEPAEYDPPPLTLLKGSLELPNTAVQSLLATVKAYFESAKLLPEGDMGRYKIIEALTEVEHKILFKKFEALSKESWVTEVEEDLKKTLSTLASHQGQILMVGQSHIDLAWLWPVKEAVRKCSRTFSTMSTLLEENPNFTYAQSQPQAYEFVKKHYPDIYRRVKKHIAEGRWEVVGGMWVEPDLNMPSGESLVRQLLYGMKFYKEEFGVQPRIEWLPDTFGYCASLPQLLKGAGIDYFMTTKMNWNDTNPFPYDLFYWEGIDGTRILSYLNHGVNEYTHPKEVKDHWESFKQKNVFPKQMLLYGHGDGGGGVTQEMIDYIDRSSSLPGLPAVVNSTAHEFFDDIKEANPRLPSWVGDMYLELHRGTYTTHARNKKWNRQAEVLYRDAEIWGSFASNFAKATGHPSSLEEGWKLLLLNQFHDIIPGSSVPEVYVDSESDYKEIFEYGEKVRQDALHALEAEINTEGNGVPIILFNSLSWMRSESVKIVGGSELTGKCAVNKDGVELPTDLILREDGQIELSVHVPDIPEMGYKTIWLKDSGKQVVHTQQDMPHEWDTEHYVVEWNEKGEISRLYDKGAKREVLQEGAAANQFQLFHDRPLLWDAWDIDPEFENQPAESVVLVEQGIQRGTTKDVIRFKWQLSQSTIEQDMILYHHSKRIDFQTKVDWQEQHKLLKVAFPVDVVSSKATFEIPFGSVERATHANTSWERAQFEVCGHRFADLSEANYGVSLLNDCKYGYDVKQNVMRLSLLRAPKWPDKSADIGIQEFTYSLFPHEGDWRKAEVVNQGYELNHPVNVFVASAHQGRLPNSHSFIETESKQVILDTVKQSEDGTGLVLRMYESNGGRESVHLSLTRPVTSAHEANLLEEKQACISIKGNNLSSSLKPYEVKTIIITL
nr:alpha-mannosidase [Neobacillus niacini]